MDAMQPPRLLATLDRRPRKADREQLPRGDDSVLRRGQFGDPEVT